MADRAEGRGQGFDRIEGAGEQGERRHHEIADRGGMIQFVTAANRVRFEINLQSAREAGLMMSSELLRVASAVRTGGGPV